MMRVAPCDTFTFPVTVAISIVQDPSLGTVTLPLIIPVKVPVQFVSARTVDTLPKSAATARARASITVFITLVRPSDARPTKVATASESSLLTQRQDAFLIVRMTYPFSLVQGTGYFSFL